MIIGAVIGAAVGAATSVVSQVASGQKINWHEVGKQAAIGAVAGAISGLAGPEAGPFVKAAVDGVANAAGQMVSNAIDGKPLTDGVLEAGAMGALSSVGASAVMKVGGSLLKGAGNLIHSAGEETEAETGAVADAVEGGCSFSYDTSVATPSGEQKIGTLKVGDQVLAYDPQTKQIGIQTVQYVWVNHDNDLIDVTLHTNNTDTAKGAGTPEAGKGTPTILDKQASQQASATDPGASVKDTQDETIHTTTKHPWLTLDRSWVNAGALEIGERVLRDDGTVAIVVGLRRLPSQSIMYNLQVSQVHTFLVGLGEYVVHNRCNYGKLRTNNPSIGSSDAPHHIIPCACKDDKLVLAAGYDIDGAGNGRGLARDSATAAGRNEPSHPLLFPNGYHRNYNTYVKGLLKDEYDTLAASGAPISQSSALDAVNRVIDQANQYIDAIGARHPGLALD